MITAISMMIMIMAVLTTMRMMPTMIQRGYFPSSEAVPHPSSSIVADQVKNFNYTDHAVYSTMIEAFARSEHEREREHDVDHG